MLESATVLEVGNEEKRTIRAQVFGGTGRTKVFTDGNDVLNKVKLYSFGDRTETFTVGTSVQHMIHTIVD